MTKIAPHPSSLAIKRAGVTLVLALLVVTSIGIVDWAKSGARNITTVETIQGIPFTVLPQGATAITESLAHADIELKESVFGKNAVVTISFIPYDITVLDIGIRENPFWLSYTRIPIYNEAKDTLPKNKVHTKTVVIPLTDKIQDSKRTIDLMLLSDTRNERATDLKNNRANSVYWELDNISVTVNPSIPTPSAIKDFAKSILSKERPL